MEPYSNDLRERVLADSDAGLTTKAVAETSRVSRAWVRRLKQRPRQVGEVAPRPARNRRRPAWAEHTDHLADLVRQQPDATLAELRGRLGLAVSLTTVWRAVRALRLTVKKKWPGRRSRTGPT